ncbi:MAG: hypothetical protein M1820_000594 [Bogoriella megaspora]|nr:MAG: hypothetical protein M1820_000594 [Bogoriella megaspora]
MHFPTTPVVLGLAALISSATSAPMIDFTQQPPSDAVVNAVQQQAHGTLPQSSPNVQAPAISYVGLVNLRLIAFNEMLESVFFQELFDNVTSNDPNYQNFGGYSRSLVIEQLNATIAQEAIHAYDANGALAASGQEMIQPCKYNFNVTTFDEAIQLAATIGDFVLGVLQDVEDNLAQNGDHGLVRQLASVIGTEGEQEGFYRILQKNENKVPNSQPFLTTSAGKFAYSAIMGFVVPGSCNATNFDLIKKDFGEPFKPLTVETQNIKPETQDLTYSFPFNGSEGYQMDNPAEDSLLRLVLLNAQNKPSIQRIENSQVADGKITFTAKFPYEENLMNGLTVAAIATGTGDDDKDFSTVLDVVNAAIVGPGLIEVN